MGEDASLQKNLFNNFSTNSELAISNTQFKINRLHY